MRGNLYFLGGVLMGGAIGVALIKISKKFKKSSDEKFQGVEFYEPKPRKPEEGDHNVEWKKEFVDDIPRQEKPDVMAYAAKLRENGYKRDYTAPEAPVPQKPEDQLEEEDYIFVIPPEEFGDDPDYTSISLTYYADDILADENDHEMDDREIDEFVGFGFEKHFGEYEDDSVFIRNDKLKCYFEILADSRRYCDILKKKPYLKEY